MILVGGVNPSHNEKATRLERIQIPDARDSYRKKEGYGFWRVIRKPNFREGRRKLPPFKVNPWYGATPGARPGYYKIVERRLALENTNWMKSNNLKGPITRPQISKHKNNLNHEKLKKYNLGHAVWLLAWGCSHRKIGT
jgi:hypothetical protein